MQLKWFVLPFVADGRKDLEVRTADEKRSKIKVGEVIIFANTYARRVKSIRRYTSFQEMLAVEDPDRIMPTWMPERILSGLRQIYSPEKEQLGIIVFELEAVT